MRPTVERALLLLDDDEAPMAFGPVRVDLRILRDCCVIFVAIVFAGGYQSIELY